MEAKREAAVRAMIAKGYTRERAEHLLFAVVGEALSRRLTCSDCLAGVDTAEHHAECIAPLDQIEEGA